MRMRWKLVVFALIAGSVALSSWVGSRHWVEAQGYGGGGTGTSALTFEPKSLTVQQGKAASVKVTVTLSSGKTWATNLRVSDVPAGVTINFEPASGDPTFTSTMTVKAASTAKPGTYAVKVQATGDDPSPIAQYGVTIEKASSGYGY